MAKVYAWPPVGHIAAEWSMVAPVGVSRSLITGASYVSAAQRRRRVATLEVSALAMGRNGAGYMEALKRLLDGGVHLVRLYSTPINWHLDDMAMRPSRERSLSWIMPPEDLSWRAENGALDYTMTPFTGTAVADGDWPAVEVIGLPASQLVARPGEFVSLGGETAMVLRPAFSDASGQAVIRLMTELSGAGELWIGARETGVFAADEIPRAVQPLGANWSYSWSFTEVFEDEGRGPFEEVNPWS